MLESVEHAGVNILEFPMSARLVRENSMRGAYALLLWLSFYNTAIAQPIESVCTTDDQTLNSIKTNPDQTLWMFMQSVCRGEFVITQGVDGSPPKDLTQGSSALQTAASIAKPLSAPQPAMVADPEVTASFISPPLFPAEPVSVDPVVVDTAAVEQPAAIDPVASSQSHKSKRPWLYALFIPQPASPHIEDLPAPLEYKPSRFSNYRPDYLAEATASAHAKGLVQKPDVMSVTPQGLYVGTSLSWNRVNDIYSALPSFVLGYANERAVREFTSYAGLGSRFEVKVQRLKDRNDQTKWNQYSATGEAYVPLGGGFFSGLGGRYEFDNDIPFPREGNYDSDAWYSYLPIGVGFTNSAGHSGKIQINTLIAARAKAKLSQLASATYSDAIAKLRVGDAYGLDVSYAWNTNSEAFVNYWWYSESKPFTLSRNGVQVTDRTPKQQTLDVGFRYHW
jgi:hypothetical protein